MSAGTSAGQHEPVAHEENGAEASESESSDSDEPPKVEVEAWDSQDDLDFKPGLTWWQAAFSLVVVVIGAGVMALPQLPKKGGVFPTAIAMLLCGVTISESGFAMWKGFMAGNKTSEKGKKSIVSYEDFGHAAFGEVGAASVVVMLVFYFIGVCAGFSVLIADSLAHLTSHWLDTKTWLIVMYPVFGCLAMLPNVTAIAKLVPLAVVAIVLLCSTIIFKSVMDGQRWQAWPDLDEKALHKRWPEAPLDLGIVVASLFGAFGVIGNVPSVLCEMKDPMQFPLAFKTALCIVGGLYLVVMGAGYYGYGEFIQSDIVDSLTSFPANQTQAFQVPFEDWTGPKAKILEDILSSLLLVKLMIGLPLNYMVIFYSFQTFKHTKHVVPPGSFRNKVMRGAIVALAVLVARLVPDFGELFALVCSIFGPLLQVIFPLFFGYKIRHELGAKRSSCPRRALHALMVVVAIFTITIGFWESLQDVLSPGA